MLKYTVIVLCGIVIGIIVIGGVVWFMAGDNSMSKIKNIKIGLRKGAVPPKKDKNGIVDNRKNFVPKSKDDLKAKAKAIINQEISEQNPKKLKYGFPIAEDILKAEAEAQRAYDTYNTIRDITQLYLERMGIRDILKSIVEITEYVPQGLREYDKENNILPLHVSVWNTSANTLKRQCTKLFYKYEKFEQRDEEYELADIETKKEELLKNIRVAYEYSNKNDSHDSEWKLQRAIDAYSARKNAADESFQKYNAVVTEEKKTDVKALCLDLKKIIYSDAFNNLKEYEKVDSGEKVLLNTVGEEMYIDSMTKAYHDKVELFVAEVRAFLKKWDDKFES